MFVYFIFFSIYAVAQRNACDLQGVKKFPWQPWGSGSWYSNWGNITSCQFSSMFIPHATETVPKTTVPMAEPIRHWSTDISLEVNRC